VAAYVIADVQITNRKRYKDYTAHILESIARYGGRWVVRGGATQVLEGDWNPDRVVVIEFSSVEAALAWFNSDDYQELAAIRREASTARILVAEGV
jgi:uncharacterized protein (DUF1330 family)